MVTQEVNIELRICESCEFWKTKTSTEYKSYKWIKSRSMSNRHAKVTDIGQIAKKNGLMCTA